jgi:hypothetical protein
MTTLQTPRRAADDRFLEARARRIAGRIEALCQRRVPECRAAAVMSASGRRFDLSVGLRDGAPGERVWARELDVAKLDSDADLERLARFLEVWIEPQAPPAAVRRARRAERSLAAGGEAG